MAEQKLRRVTDPALLQELNGTTAVPISDPSQFTVMRDPNWKGLGSTPEDQPVGFGTTLLGNIPQDPATRARFYAERLFPGDPSAVNRFTVRQGKLSYVDNQGRLKSVEGSGFADAAGRFLSNAPEMIGGAIGGILATPGSPVAQGAGAGLGAAAGKAGKQIAANLIFGEPQSPLQNAFEQGKEFVTNATMTAAMTAVPKYLDMRKMQSIDRMNLDDISRQQDDIFNRTGIRPDVAQVTNNPHLIALKTYAQHYPGEAAQLVQANDALIAGQVDDAITRVLDLVSTEPSLDVQGIRGINGAKAAIEMVKAQRKAATEPLYAEALQLGGKPNLVKPLAYLETELASAKGAVRSELLKARKLLNQPGTDALDETMAGTHNAKVAVQAQIDRLGPRENNIKRILRNVYDQLDESLVGASPKYAEATEVYKRMTNELVAPLDQGIVGLIANIPTRQASQAAAKLYAGQVPSVDQIRYAKSFILKTEGGEDAWNSLVRQHLQTRFDQASRITRTGDRNVAGAFRQLVAGTPAQRRALNEMLGDSNASRLMDDVLGALEMVSRTKVVPSQTAFQQEVGKQLGGRLASALKFLSGPLQTIRDLADNAWLERNTVKVAQGLTDPTRIQALKRIQQMPPSTYRSFALAGVLLGDQSGRAVDYLTQPTTQTLTATGQ